MHLCGWHPDGKNRCNEPASKCVQFELDDTDLDSIRIIWLCDRHYQDETLVQFWKKMNVRPHF